MIYEAILAVFRALAEAVMKFVNEVLFPTAHGVAKFGRSRAIMAGNRSIQIVDDVAM